MAVETFIFQGRIVDVSNRPARGIRLAVVAKPGRQYAVVGTETVFARGAATETNVNGEFVFELITFPELYYTIYQENGTDLEPVTFSAPDADTVLDLASVTPATPSPIPPVDAQQLRAEFIKSGAGAANLAEIAAAKDRVNHTGTQPSTTISDFREAAQDAVALMLTSGSNITLSYDDAGNTYAITAAGTDAEKVRDTIGAAIAGVNGIGVSVNDAADTITLTVSGVSISQVTGLQAALDGMVTKTAADTSSTADRDRANHTGSQNASTIADLAESVQDIVGAFLQNGTGTTVVYDDATNSIKINAAAGASSGTDPEAVRDTIAAALSGAGLVSVTSDDTADTITISTTATQNSTDAALRARASHTGTQTASTIADLTEAVQDIVGAFFANGIQTTVVYDDAANTIKVNAVGADAEAMRDAVGAAMVGSGLVSVVYNDALDTITISTTATQNSSDASLRDRSTHTGTQTASTISDLAESVRDTIGAAISGTGLAAVTVNDAADTIVVSTTATQNATDAALRDRSTHTGTQTAATIADLTEAVQDVVGAFFTNGVQTTVTYDDANNTLKVDATGADAETMRDTIGAALAGVGLVTVTVNDAADTITISTTATQNSSDAALRARSSHTGTQTLATISDAGTAAGKTAGDAAGNVPVLNSNAQIDAARLGSGTASSSTVLYGDQVFRAPPAGSGGSGGTARLAYASLNPASITTYQTPSGTPVDFPSSGSPLSVTFTATSTQVEVIQEAPSNGQGSAGYWSLREGTTDLSGSLRLASGGGASTTRIRSSVRITGLTVGQSYTWKWAYRSDGQGGYQVYAGGIYGAAIMEVLSVT